MTLADTADSPHASRRRAPLRRAYSAVSPTGFLSALGFALIFSIGRSINDVLISVRDGNFGGWLLSVGGDFAGHALMVLVLIAVIGPVMSLGPAPGWRRAGALAAAIVVGASVAALVRIVQVNLTMDTGAQSWPQLLGRFFIRFLVRYGYLAMLFVVVVEFYRYEVKSVLDMHGAEVDRLALDREMAAARLQVLQAQIEPHFLFNTLANVRRLYQTDAATGREMLDNLMRYLEVALPRMRDESSTLGREAALIESFLNVQKIRMGRRLTFEIDIAPELQHLSVPPMMLLTLVENALKHGLHPLPEGGLVRISAAVRNEQLVLAVGDTGRGFGEGTSGGGTGLANIRARLAAMFGAAASLGLVGNSPRGITATLTLPVPAREPVAAHPTAR